MIITLRDGGTLKITNRIIGKWAKLYPNVNILDEITLLNNRGVFSQCTKKGALKLINKRLMSASNE